MKILLAFLFILIMSDVSLALENNEGIYHCPSIKDIKYQHGTFTSFTNYNDIQMNWFTVQNFPESTVPIIKFKFTHGWQDCIGGTCEIYCVYQIDSKVSDVLKFSVSRQAYRFSQAESGPWQQSFCESDIPEECQFKVVKHKQY